MEFDHMTGPLVNDIKPYSFEQQCKRSTRVVRLICLAVLDTNSIILYIIIKYYTVYNNIYMYNTYICYYKLYNTL